MPEGGCFCAKVRISVEGDPAMKALCHCADCRKISGGAYSTNVVFPDSGFKLISGQPKTIEKKADSGKSITSFFCGDCGTTLYRQGEAFKDMTIVKYGIMDDPKSMEDAKPGAELYAPERPSWIPQVSGTQEMKAMS